MPYSPILLEEGGIVSLEEWGSHPKLPRQNQQYVHDNILSVTYLNSNASLEKSFSYSCP